MAREQIARMYSVTAPLFDLEGRILSLQGDIGSEEVNRLVDLLLRLDATNDKEITLYVSGRGGDMIQALQMVDTVRLLRAPVAAVGLGLIQGAGVVLLAACSRRVLFASSILSTAGIWSLAPTHPDTDHRIGLHHGTDHRLLLLAKVREQVAQAFAAWPGRIPSFLSDPSQPPQMFDATEAIQIGLADSIVIGADRRLSKPQTKKLHHAKHTNPCQI